VVDLNKIYRHYYSSAKSQLRKWGCKGDIFEELYQQTFFILVEMQETGKASSTYSLGYVTQICKNLWFKEQKRRRIYNLIDEFDQIQYLEAESSKGLIFLLVFHMKSLSSSCREILTLYSHGYSEEKISAALKLRGPKTVNNKKLYCKEKLRNMILNDPLYKELNG
jgi:DNA-directed RNA polymerase specialized sigma24 family protein